MDLEKVFQDMMLTLREAPPRPAAIVRTLRELSTDLRYLAECGEDEEECQLCEDRLYELAERLVRAC